MDQMVITLIELIDELMEEYYGISIERERIQEFDGTCGGKYIPSVHRMRLPLLFYAIACLSTIPQLTI